MNIEAPPTLPSVLEGFQKIVSIPQNVLSMPSTISIIMSFDHAQYIAFHSQLDHIIGFRRATDVIDAKQALCIPCGGRKITQERKNSRAQRRGRGAKL